MKVAVTQMTSGGAIRENLATAVQLVKRAALAGVQAVFLPEATDFIATPDRAAELTRSDDNRAFVQGMRDAAREHAVWISVGVHESSETDTKRCYNTQLLIDQHGTICAQYRKLHLYDVDILNGPSILESNTTIPGDKLVPPVDTPLGRIGVRVTVANPAPDLLRHAFPRSVARAASPGRTVDHLPVGVCSSNGGCPLVLASPNACHRDAVLRPRRGPSRYVSCTH